MPAAVQTPTADVTDSVISRRPSVERGVDAQIESRRLFYAPSSISTKSQDRIPGAEHAQMEARKAMFAGVLGLFKNYRAVPHVSCLLQTRARLCWSL